MSPVRLGLVPHLGKFDEYDFTPTLTFTLQGQRASPFPLARGKVRSDEIETHDKVGDGGLIGPKDRLT